MSISEAMIALYPRTHGPECADKYRAIAEWWRLNAKLSAHPAADLAYAANQDDIAADMTNRPHHHERKPVDVSRYLWSLQ